MNQEPYIHSISLDEELQALRRRVRELESSTEARRDIEERLHRAEDILKTVTEAAEDSIFIKDAHLRYTYVNPAMERVLGLPASELVGKTPQEVFGEKDAAVVASVDKTVLAGEIVNAVRTLTINGVDRTFHTVQTPVVDVAGNVHTICGIVRDVTDLRRAEEALAKANEELDARVQERTAELTASNRRLQEEIAERGRAEESLRRHNEALDQALDGIAIADMDGIIEYTNRAWAAMHGRTVEECLGGHLRQFHTEEQMERDVIPFNKMLLEKGGNSGRVGHVDRDGNTFPTHMACSVLTDRGGKTIGLIGIARDISKELAIEARLRHAQKMEAVGVLAGGIAHNLRNILAAMLGWIEIASGHVMEEGIVSTSLARATKSGQRASDHVTQLLRFSRRTETRREPVDLAAVTREAVALLRTMLPPTVTIRALIDGYCPPVLADAEEVQQVIVDLGSNAFHAMPGDGAIEVDVSEVVVTPEQAEVHVELEAGPYVRLTVSDTGHGMDEETVQHIFEPFFTTRKPGEGTGLGLAIVHGIVASHNGAIEVRSEPGNGTSFAIFLPVCPSNAMVKEPHRPASERVKDTAKTTRVLLVDDDEEFLEMARTGLELLGYAVEGHTSPAEAWRVFRGEPGRFNVVITDNLMPGMSGLALAAQMRNLRPNITILLISGVSEQVDQTAAEDAGISERLSKPATPRGIAAAIQRALGRPAVN